MSVKNNGQRVFIIVIVVIFLLTAVASTIFVIIDAAKGNDSTATTSDADLQSQIDQAQLQQQDQQQQTTPQEGKLEGTKLADFTPIAKVDSLQKIDLKEGTGAAVAEGGTVTAHYTGALAKDGTIFQSSKDTGQPFTAPLSGVIPGWGQGIPGMKVGGIRRLVIPAELAYGNQATGNIPAGSDLVFDIELIATQ